MSQRRTVVILVASLSLALTLSAQAASRVATPTMSPAAGTYNNSVTVTLSVSTAGAKIYYTTNGTTPTTSSTLYASPITLNATTTVQAIAVATGYTNSAVASATYTMVVATPTMSPAAGTYNNSVTVTLSDSTAGAKVYYTTNGTTPTTSSTLYTSPVTVNATTTLKAIAAATGYTNSAVASATYTMVVATPTMSPAGGTYSSPQAVVLSDTTAGAKIYYTTNGTTPTTSSTLYTGPVTVNATTTLKAIAAATGYTNSAVASATYTMVVATPTMSPATGTYNSSVTVTLSDSTAGAKIYYTTNGTTPTTSSTLYTGPVTVNATTTLKAIAAATGYTNSTVASATYTMVVATPSMSPAGGTYGSPQAVASSDTTAGAKIYYTTNGTTPTTSSTLYSGPVTVNATTTLKAIAAATGYTNSAVASATYTIIPAAAAPVFSVPGGTYTSTQTVSISDGTPGAQIYFTTDGSTPTTSSRLYSAPLAIAATTTLKAIATATGYSPSAVTSATYTITLPAAAPTFSLPTGTYTSAQFVSIADSTPGAQIYFTTDGSTPTTGSALYGGPISVGTTLTLKAIATATGYSVSTVASATYTITPPAAAPVFSVPAGTYTTTQTVAISDATPGAQIFYTIDGSTPTTTSPVYGGPLAVSSTTTLKAIATATGYSTSAVASAIYTITPPAATPSFSIPAGTYTSTQTVAISDSTPNAQIYYTTDGSVPSTGSTPYSVPVSVSATETLKAIAFAPGYSASAIASASYTISPPAATPTFSVPAGTYTTPQTVAISDSTPGAQIFYTVDGSTPTTSSSLYGGPLTIGSTTTLKAIATATGYSGSAIASAAYTITPPAATPVFSVPPGTYVSSQTVSISDTTSGAQIFYTTDGSVPTTSSAPYSVPVSISATTTLKAIAVATGFSASAVASATYTITPPATTPAFSIPGGTYTTVQTVAISDATPSAQIYFTTDGSTPTTSSALYSGPVSISATTTLKAIATAAGYSNSAVASATYTITPPAAAPTFSVLEGTYSAPQTVAILDATPGAQIHFTTDGTAPTTASTLYSGPISIGTTTTINAIAVAPGYGGSAVATATYTIAIVLSSIAVTPPSASVDVGATQQFAALGSYSDGSTGDLTGQVTWSSTAPGVATIGPTGLATAQAPGTTTIAAAQGSVSGNASILVRPVTQPMLSCPYREAPGPTVVVFDDGPQNCFRIESTHSVVPAQSSVVHSGVAAMAFDPSGGNDLSLSRTGVTLQYSALSLWVHGGSAGNQSVDLEVVAGGVSIFRRSLASLLGYSVPAGSWAQVAATFQPTSSDALEIHIVGTGSGGKLYIDDVVLTPALAQTRVCNLAAGASCSDGNACNGLEVCDGAGSCLAGVPPVVDDGNPCTADSCDALAGVIHTPLAVGTNCSDGNVCTGAKACNGSGACVAGPPPALDDGNPCTADFCTAAGGIQHVSIPACGVTPPPATWLPARMFSYDPIGNLTGIIDASSDGKNCGAVGQRCPGGSECVNAVCGVWFVVANKPVFVPVSTDPYNCGAVGNACPTTDHGTATCTQGSCSAQCDAGYVAAGGRCVNLLSDPTNCGSVGNVCSGVGAGTATCTNGLCGSAGAPQVQSVNGVAPPGRSFRQPPWAGFVVSGTGLEKVTKVEVEFWGVDADASDNPIPPVPSGAATVVSFEASPGALSIPAEMLEAAYLREGTWYKLRLHYGGQEGDALAPADVAVSFGGWDTPPIGPPLISQVSEVRQVEAISYDPTSGFIATRQDPTQLAPQPVAVLAEDLLWKEFPILGVTPAGVFIQAGLLPSQIVRTTLGGPWDRFDRTNLVFPYTNAPGDRIRLGMGGEYGGGVILRGANLLYDGPLTLVSAAGETEVTGYFLGDRIVSVDWDRDMPSQFHDPGWPLAALRFDSPRGTAATPWVLNWRGTPEVSAVDGADAAAAQVSYGTGVTVSGRWLVGIESATFTGVWSRIDPIDPTHLRVSLSPGARPCDTDAHGILRLFASDCGPIICSSWTALTVLDPLPLCPPPQVPDPGAPRAPPWTPGPGWPPTQGPGTDCTNTTCTP